VNQCVFTQVLFLESEILLLREFVPDLPSDLKVESKVPQPAERRYESDHPAELFATRNSQLPREPEAVRESL
jgi:hypothetical protein